MTAPSPSERDSSGTISPKSMPITRPKPRQVSHAPIGELNENWLGTGSAYWMSQSGQCKLVEKRQGSTGGDMASLSGAAGSTSASG